MKSIIKNLLVTPYTWCLRTYDRITEDMIECSIADIILQRGDVVNENQLLLSSRLCDVEDYCDRGLTVFIHQNTISRKKYGASHKEDGGNRSFAALIDSYRKNGYDPSSLVTVDSNITLMDGNHRMGLHLYEKIEKVNIRRVHRKPPYQYGVDSFYALGLETSFLEKLHMKYKEIQDWLIDSGNTFCVVIKNVKNDRFEADKDLMHLCKVLKSTNLNGGGILLQFSMHDPRYSVIKGQLYSLRARDIEKVLKKRYGKEAQILVSKNCIEGKWLYDKFIK